jgi:hypothetical protein
MIKRIVESATITAREISIKIVSGREFRVTYAPREEKEAVRYFAKLAGVNTALLETDTLGNLLAAVVQQGADEATLVAIQKFGGRLGGGAAG